MKAAPLRILVVGSKYPPEYAGSGVLIHDYYKRLKGRGKPIEVNVITNSIEFPGNANYIYDGVQVKRISSKVLSGWRKLPGIFLPRLFHALKAWSEAVQTWLALRRLPCDVIHVFGMSSSTATAILFGSLKKVPLVIELVTTGATPKQTLPFLRSERCLRLSEGTAIVAISQALAEKCSRLGFKENIWVRPNPIDEVRFCPEFGTRMKVRQKHTPFGKNDKLLTMVAKFMPQKNQSFLIEVMEKLPGEYKLILAGPLVEKGPLADRDRQYFEKIQDRINESGLEERVLLRPHFVDSAEFMKMSDVYLLPNKNEGLGSPMLEALACGIPVVANSNEPPFRQWVVDGENGFLRPLDADAWAKAIMGADKIEMEKRLAASCSVLNAAGAKKIDGDFYAILRGITSVSVEKQLDVEACIQKYGHLNSVKT